MPRQEHTSMEHLHLAQVKEQLSHAVQDTRGGHNGGDIGHPPLQMYEPQAFNRYQRPKMRSNKDIPLKGPLPRAATAKAEGGSPGGPRSGEVQAELRFA